MKLENIKPGDKLYVKNGFKESIIIVEVNYRDGYVIASWGGREPKRYEKRQVEQFRTKP